MAAAARDAFGSTIAGDAPFSEPLRRAAADLWAAARETAEITRRPGEAARLLDVNALGLGLQAAVSEAVTHRGCSPEDLASAVAQLLGWMLHGVPAADRERVAVRLAASGLHMARCCEEAARTGFPTQGAA